MSFRSALRSMQALHFVRIINSVCATHLQGPGVVVSNMLPATQLRLKSSASNPNFVYQELLEMSKAQVPWRKLTSDYVSEREIEGKKILEVRNIAFRQASASNCCCLRRDLPTAGARWHADGDSNGLRAFTNPLIFPHPNKCSLASS